MKTSVITDEISQDLEEAIQVAECFHLNAIELRTVWDRQPHELTEEQISKIKSLVEQHHLGVCAIASPFYKCALCQKEISQHLEILRKTIWVAKRLDCKIIRGFSFWAEGDFDAALGRIVRAFDAPIQMLQEADRILAIEPDPSVYACNGARTAQLVHAIGNPNVQILWDAGNDVYSPEYERPFPDGYRKVQGNVVHVHLKDAVVSDGKAQCVALGRGIVNWPEQLKALKHDGFDGYISLETHYRKDAQLGEGLMRLPGGSAFSFGAREASEECLGVLNRMLRTV